MVIFGCTPKSGKCRLDIAGAMYAAQRGDRKYTKKVIKSDTFPGCLSEELLEWIFHPLS